MAIYRTVSMTFWTDPKVTDDFTPEDRYFYLYLFTNPHTNLSGCYEISLKQMSTETGYSKDSIENLLKRFEKVHDVIRYCTETKEILLLNWHKYNWTESPKFRKPLEKEIQAIKDNYFREYLQKIFDGEEERYRIDTNCIDTTVTVTVINNTKEDNTLNTIKEIINYFNDKCNTNYKYGTKSTQKHISARLNEGFTFDDFKIVIDKMYDEWHGTDMEKYLRPETLFAGKFEGYLNRKAGKKNNSTFDEEKFKAMNDSKWQ